MRYHNITKDDMLNGDGLRVVLWVSGCSHCCKGCQNPITWDVNGGVVFDVTINGVSIYNCRVVEGNNGDFVSFPARKGSDGNYYSHAYIKLTEDDTKKIIGLVEKALEE